jgi:lipopolysaccharide export system protein LptC
MADTVAEERVVKQRWAEPGSAHDWLVRWLKILLPAAAGVVLVLLALAPLHRKGDVSFILDKKKVQTAAERMRVELARYTGTDNKGQPFVMTANHAVQRSSDTPIVDVQGLFARLTQEQGPMLITADQGRYNLDTQKVSVIGPVKIVGTDGFTLDTSDVTLDLKTRQLASNGPAEGAMRLGRFRADHIRADLGSHTVVLDGGARLKITQGVVR